MLNSQQLIGLMTIGLFLIGIQPTIAQSNANIPTPTNRSKPQQIIFKPPSNQGKPKFTSSGGSRSNWQCPQDTTLNTTSANKTPLMLLAPTDSNYGLTIAEHPTFLVYLPQTSAKQVILSLITEDNQLHSQSFIPIKGEPGIISIKSADSSPPLEVGKNYQWALVLVCGEKPSPNDPVITSWVRRVALPQLQSHQRTTFEQVDAYSEQGIWYDAVIALAQIKKTQPKNQAIADTWTDFLKSVGLDAIATQPLRL
ncbi:hypothetical protein NIES4072_26040 [Nostoc commune NIES-4072]|uniref:DUF928 domain-containing protein n=1 Tax=Nostoc commune NIES-4072 TaxID=2005467 RepID=A0A2R5FLP5_NOSCO|nr:DUF928 domain-containing protein [Nostoc commune]BBD63740.1 hypothetical protein NIES4070_00820 [Nostoc commune HK-02]GBG18939.1 hypothetical protein NIES4072_26040 [Nostoc commune NIES-4072]